MGMADAGLQLVTGGLGLGNRPKWKPGHDPHGEVRRGVCTAVSLEETQRRYDNLHTFTKVNDVYHSGTKHDEDQPGHLLVADANICVTRCRRNSAIPASASAPPTSTRWSPTSDGRRAKLKINPSNCVHCKTCDITDPYEIITWVPPEGGGGPNYPISFS